MALSILIADDHPAVLYGLRQALERQPRNRFVVSDTVEGGEALMRSLRGRDCDVALVDWYMPAEAGPAGRELLARLRSVFPQTAVVVMTASQQPAVLAACLAAGAKGLFDKRESTEHLPRLLNHAAQGKLCVSPGLEAVLDRHYLSRHHWGLENTNALTPREREVIRLSAEGYTGRQIAARLQRSEKTISRQRRSALDKLGLNADALPATVPSTVLSLSW